MRIVGKRLPGCALLLVVSACIHRPLGEPDDGAAVPGVAGQGGATGQGGQAGTACSEGEPRLELIGTQLTVLDQPPTNGNLYTSLVWTGGEYLFIWRLFGGADVLMQRIAGNGEAVGGNIRVRAYEDALDVAWGASRLAAVWARKNGTDGRLMFQTFDALGRPLIEETTLRASAGIAIDGSVMYGPRIAAIGDEFALVWIEADQVFVGTVDVEGNLLRGPFVASSGDLRSTPTLSLAAADDRFAIGWTGPWRTTSPGPPQALTATRVYSSGLMSLGGANTLDTQVFDGMSQVLATGAGFLDLWTHNVPSDFSVPVSDAEVRIAQLDGTGASVANGIMDPPARGPVPDLMPAVWNRDHLVVLWGGRNPNVDTGLTLSRFAPSGARQGESLTIPTMVPAARLYLTAHDGTLAFIWAEEVDRGWEVYFQQARSCP